MMLAQGTSIATSTKSRVQIREITRPTVSCASRPALLPNVATPLASPAIRKAQRGIRPPSAAATSSGVPTADSSRGAKVIDNVYDVIVVGGGLSGLVTGQALAAQHGVKNFLVTEARERVGGNITSMAGDGYVWEEGPNSFQPNDSMLQVAVDAGVDKDLVFGDPKAPRFVFWQNKLRPVPSGLDAFTFDLMSIPGKIRAGLGAIGLINGAMPAYEESVEQFIRRNLGDEVFERLIEPFCSGVYAGNPAKLSMKAAFNRIWILEKNGGSLVGGALKLFQDRKKNPPPPRDPRLPPKPKGQTVGSFRLGLKMLPEAIERRISDQVRVNWKLVSLTRDGERYSLVYDTPEGRVQCYSRAVALTAPSYVVADLIKEEVPAAAEALSSFDYPPVGAVTLSYPLSAIREDRKDEAGNVPGFGQLHPRSQGVTTLGTIYSSSLFPGRAPPGHMLLLNYIGGATNRGIVNQTQEQLAAQVDKDLRLMVLKPDAPAPKVVGVRVWPRAIPQFNIGHLDQLDKARAALDAKGWGGVFLGGNYVSGVALGKVVEYGYESAANLAKHVQTSSKKAAAV
ncbi:fatty-acyl coenzyme A oxidase [Pleodorina starrii]|uniref:Protoporphyrinogen oxidase n=1 Tax=Pleodorina starrii TaxID=330485 RepID=A0A9W6BVF2_9CHLO|nr:fatty-acyl coenzyme A oxidase [Pleodorina starrii]GLC58550.1 fatty-acyl coenzyme A oxidase [Pleodorina starrii]GLC74203.1 fatty-acyl coenzyme A oxidase [Pleodorina starrii]